MVTTININKNIKFSKTNFESLEELQEAILLLNIQEEISTAHKEILDFRIKEANQNPKNYMSLSELKNSIRRS